MAYKPGPKTRDCQIDTETKNLKSINEHKNPTTTHTINYDPQEKERSRGPN